MSGFLLEVAIAVPAIVIHSRGQSRQIRVLGTEKIQFETTLLEREPRE